MVFKSLNETRSEKTKRLEKIPMNHLKDVLASTVETVKQRPRDLPMKFTLQCLPLSTNMMSGRNKTYETKTYIEYKTHIAEAVGGNYGLPKGAKYKMTVKVGFSSKLADVDNIFKPLLDSITRCVDDTFDDRMVFKVSATKEIVKKGHEYIDVWLDYITEEEYDHIIFTSNTNIPHHCIHCGTLVNHRSHDDDGV